MAQNDGSRVKPGKIYLEARVKSDIDLEVDESEVMRQDLERLLSIPDRTFDLGEDILANKYRASLLLGEFYEEAAIALLSLKVVEYNGPNLDTTCHSSNDVTVKVHVYKLYKTGEEREALQQSEITSMPHMSFAEQWDELVFEENLKGELIRLVTNMIRFSRKPGAKRPVFNPLILMHGPPGTGKTTLCQGLAQKISIRLNSIYKHTKLIQIKTATLLSKFYSQSAKQVDEIFTAIEKMCEEDSEQLICVLIDEVESIANSRESTMHGEAQDSLRATNALLTGLDRAKEHSNVIFLCTSNMLSCLDAAFLDRCGLKIAMDPPLAATQYEILRGRIQKLIDEGHIVSNTSLPSYRDAELEFNTDSGLPGSRLLGIIKLINSLDAGASEGEISGRTLTQLPGKAILRYLDEDECDLDMALNFIEKSIRSEKRQAIQKADSMNEDDVDSTGKAPELADPRGQKRKTTRVLREDSEIDRALSMLEAIENFADVISPGWLSRRSGV